MENEKYTPTQMLEEVNNAIYSVLMGGQSYRIGTRQLTRADLSMLRAMKNELEQQLESGSDDCLMDNTYVAIFSGR